MGYPTLTFQSEGSIAIIALTVPEKRNAVSAQMITDLLAALEQAQESPARVLIITGAGKSFCAGMDLAELNTLGKQTLARNLEDSRRLAKLFYRLYSFPKPVIAASEQAPPSPVAAELQRWQTSHSPCQKRNSATRKFVSASSPLSFPSSSAAKSGINGHENFF